jgi:hypothetical protein
MMLSPLALQQQEGQESEFIVRLLEPLVDGAFYKGSSYVSSLLYTRLHDFTHI